MKAMARELSGEKNFKRIEDDGECDFSVSIESGERFRVNAYKQKGNFAMFYFVNFMIIIVISVMIKQFGFSEQDKLKSIGEFLDKITVNSG